jgi:hypothetical protein
VTLLPLLSQPRRSLPDERANSVSHVAVSFPGKTPRSHAIVARRCRSLPGLARQGIALPGKVLAGDETFAEIARLGRQIRLGKIKG